MAGREGRERAELPHISCIACLLVTPEHCSSLLTLSLSLSLSPYAFSAAISIEDPLPVFASSQLSINICPAITFSRSPPFTPGREASLAPLPPSPQIHRAMRSRARRSSGGGSLKPRGGGRTEMPPLAAPAARSPMRLTIRNSTHAQSIPPQEDMQQYP